MGNCLVTKLKGVVDNDNLSVVGRMVIPMDDSDGLSGRIKVAGTNVKVSVTGDGYMASSVEDLENPNGHHYTEIIINQESYKALYLSVGNYKINLDNKYGITMFQIGSNTSHKFQNTDLNQLEYSAATIIELGRQEDQYTEPYKGVSANLKSFKKLNLTCLCLTNTSLAGNLEDIVNSINLSKLHTYNTDVEGDMETLVRAFVDKGRYNADLTNGIDIRNSLYDVGKLKIFGTYINKRSYLTWGCDANNLLDKIVVYSLNVGTETYKNCTLIYAKGSGITQSDIDAWLAEGKTVTIYNENNVPTVYTPTN